MKSTYITIFNLLCKRLIRLFALAVSFTGLLLLNGCATTVTSMSQDTEVQLDNGYGYMLMAVNTNQPIQKMHISGPSDIVLTNKDLQKGTNYVIIPLPEGRYNIAKLELQLSKFEFEETEHWKFKVEKNTISYIGEVQAEFYGWFNSNARYELINRSTDALVFLEDKFPNLLSKNKVIYGGYGEDFFLEFATKGNSLLPSSPLNSAQN